VAKKREKQLDYKFNDAIQDCSIFMISNAMHIDADNVHKIQKSTY
jgi:hypothetical protein